MTNNDQRPAHVPAPIAKVDGDIEVMKSDYLTRIGQSEIDLLRRLYAWLEGKQTTLDGIEDKQSTYAQKTLQWIAAIESKIENAEASILGWFKAEAVVNDTAPVTEQPAPTTPIDDVLTIDEARARYADLVEEMRWQPSNSQAQAIKAEIAELKAYIVRWDGLLSITGFTDAAPVDPSSLALDPENNDFQRGYGDGLYGKSPIWVSTAEYNHGYAAGQADALATDDLMTNDAGLLRVQLTDADAEIARLNRIITDLQADLHACERGRKATEEAFAGNDEAARAEIEQLRGDLFAERGAHAETTKALREVLGGHAVTEVRQVEDGAWVAVGKSLGVNYQSIEYRTKDEAYAEATLFADRHNRQLARARR